MRITQPGILCVAVSAATFSLGTPDACVLAQAMLYQEAGFFEDEAVGASVAIAGDVNGDGYADLIVGAPFARVGQVRPGRVRVVAGQSGALLHEYTGTADWDRFGHAVSGAGDVDADGCADILIGAPGADLFGTDSGLVRVMSGKTGLELFSFSGDSAYDAFGSSVAAAGDVDRDGHADLLVGAPLDDPNGPSSGSVRVISGLGGATLLLLKGDSAYDQFGWSVAGAGDVNGDGHADALVGSPWDTGAGGAAGGSARLFSGADGAALLTLHGDSVADEFGFAVAGVGDVDLDGVADLLIGARLDDAAGNNAGAAFLHSGADGALLREFHGVAADDLFGTAVAAAGDVNGDRVPDLLVGAPHDHCVGTNCGAAYVFSGSDGAGLFLFHGETGEQLGYAVGGGGDADGDGHDDMLLGAPFANFNAPGGGLARALSASLWVNASLTLGSPTYTSVFIADGSLLPSAPVTLTLSQAAPLAPSLLVLGLSQVKLPFKGGTLVPKPDIVTPAIPTDATGSLTVAGVWPAGVPADLELALQWWTLDPAAPTGFSSSNALVATTP